MAIVTELPGTTRDPIQVPLDVSGYSVLLVDTAGIRCQTKDMIEELGIQKSKDQAQQANMIILVVDAKYLVKVDNIDFWLEEYAKDMKVIGNNCLVFVNKIDTLSEDHVLKLKKMCDVSNWTICFGSCKTDKGLVNMLETLKNCLQKMLVIL